MPDNPWFSWSYVTSSWDELSTLLWQHALITVEAVLIAFVVSVPLAALAARVRWLAGPILAGTSALYTIPSLALFAILAPVLGIGRTSVLVGLVLYALVILVRNTLAGLQSVDPAVLDAARGLGFGRFRRFWSVELPGALPGILAGLRLATVSTVALVTVGVVVGYGGLGTLILRGFQSFYRAEIMTATLLCLLLALVLDVVIWAVGRALTPWRRGAGA
ncbi:ABC transporter permease [Luteimicrobium subarcticum]|uniref:Osmoprotectant transport system permease protein n=1 Tax=Luteimicrobium subarcticum TaxID=620910 RepID=A0A2M8WVS0_9MICO|nr:ABC transporter permease [Luteimicrobium subarcticum]PJI95003.1 osmoprotectant transport system permease protein [Luteimicrobium subarcticum]